MSSMLARAARASLRTPIQSAFAVNSRSALSAQWTRSLANNSRKPNRKPIDYSKPLDASQSQSFRPSSIGPQRPSPVSAAFGAQRSASENKSNDAARNSNFSNRQEEFNKSASPEQNASSERSKPSSVNEEASYSSRQEEFDTTGSASANTSPQNQSPSHGQFTTPSGQPLPDLTQGIPSTLEYETQGSTSANRSLNLTEDPSGEPSESGGGRGRGELPASAYISSSERKREQVANYMYASALVFMIMGYIYLGRNWENEEQEKEHPNAPSGWAFGLMWKRVKARMGDQISYYSEPAFKKLLPDPDPSFERPYTLVLSLEDLLIHSEWSREHGWRMAKRPGVDYFLRYLSQYYELVIFTSVPWALGDPVVRKLDPFHIVTWPLYREATLYGNGEYIKDLSYLNRDLSKVILIDTVKSHAKNQPENAIILPKWNGQAGDKELVSLIPFLEYIPTMAIPDVRTAIKSFEGTHIPTEFAKREAIARQKFEEQMALEQAKRPKSGLGLINKMLGVKPLLQYEGEETPAEAFARGKMLQDQARERGQKNYEALEKMIREEGEKWLKEEAAYEEAAKQEGLKAMKSGLTGFFGGQQGPPPTPNAGPKPA